MPSFTQFIDIPGDVPQRRPVLPQIVLLQLPPLHATPLGQSAPQVPQLRTSKRTSRQMPPQLAKGLLHAAPVLHAGCPSAAPHTTQVPLRLTVRPVQTPPMQAGCPAAPQLRQVPLTLTVPVTHAVPDTHAGWPLLPQATHMLPLALKPVLQLIPQVLLAQVAEPLLGTVHTVQAVPHAAGLAVVLRQVPPQLVRPLAHMPPMHTGCASRPHATHTPPLATKPALQVKPQLPLAQVRTPLVTVMQALPHDPQPSTSLGKSRHVPAQLV